MGAVFGKKTVVPAMQEAAKKVEPAEVAPVEATLDERAAAEHGAHAVAVAVRYLAPVV